MWPDHEDVIRNLKTIPSPKPAAEEIYADVVLARSFLDGACHYCHNHGRHQFVSVADIKNLAESFIGRTINDVALKVAMRMRGLQVKSSGSDKSVLLAKVPPLHRYEEMRDRWNEHQVAEQKEIDEEIRRWAEFRAKYPNYRP
jgi:hypothetical protein